MDRFWRLLKMSKFDTKDISEGGEGADRGSEVTAATVTVILITLNHAIN